MNEIRPTMTLCESPVIPEQYRDVIAEILSMYYRHLCWHLGQDFGFLNLPPTFRVPEEPEEIDQDKALKEIEEALAAGQGQLRELLAGAEQRGQDDIFLAPLASTLASIARAAAGQREHDELEDGMLAEEIQGVCEALFASPVVNSYNIPPEFWEDGVGAMILAAQLWLRSDRLITQAHAGRVLGVTTQAIHAMIGDGRLRGYAVPNKASRQGRVKVSQAAVKALKEQREQKG